MVEKIKRDVRITRIYEGTSEIMEMTIARGRWQEHLKSGGDYYHATARELEALHGDDPERRSRHRRARPSRAGRAARTLSRGAAHPQPARAAARSAHSIAQAEGAAALVRSAHRAATKQLHPKAVPRLRAPALAAASRVNARGAALTIATEAIRWVAGADGGDLQGFDQRLDLGSIYRSQTGLLADFQTVAEAIYATHKRA